jgi:hypothetical protein
VLKIQPHNYSEVETSGTPYYEAPIPQVPQQPERLVRKQSMVRFDDDELSDMTGKDIKDILGGIISSVIEDDDKPAVGLTLASGEHIGDVDDSDLLPLDDDEPVSSISRIYTNEEIDEFTPDELNEIADIQGITFTGPKPKKPKGIEKRAEEIRNILRTQNKSTETYVIVEKYNLIITIRTNLVSGFPKKLAYTLKQLSNFTKQTIKVIPDRGNDAI